MKIKSLFLILSILLVSCQSKDEKSKNLPENLKNDDSHQLSSDNSIELNNGEKWQINNEMVLPLNLMEKEISLFNGTEFADYKLLASLLQKNLNLFISSCKMEDKAHEELHKWLLPLIFLVQEFNESKNFDDAKRQFSEIKMSLKLFHNYFKS